MKISLGLRIALFALLMFRSCFYSNAQNTRSSLSVIGGYSLPIGQIAREDPDDPFAGLSGSGYFAQASFDYRIKSWIGVRTSASMNRNNTNSGPIVRRADEYALLLSERFNWQSDVSKWKLNALMIGPSFYIDLGRAQIGLHTQVGQIWAESPSVNLLGTSESGGQPITVDLRPASTTAFGFSGGVNLRLRIAGPLYGQLSGEVIGCEAELNDVTIRAVRGTFDFAETLSEKRLIGVVNVGAGLGISF